MVTRGEKDGPLHSKPVNLRMVKLDEMKISCIKVLKALCFDSDRSLKKESILPNFLALHFSSFLKFMVSFVKEPASVKCSMD